jgi:HEPN domain-containing protein
LSTRVFRLEDGYDPVDLLKYGRGHLHAAEILLRKDHHCLDSGGHLGHLAVELLLKAALLHHNSEFPAEHDLFKLIRLTGSAGIVFNLSTDAEQALIAIAQFEDSKYPNPTAPVEVGTEDLALIQTLWDELLEQLPASLRDPFLTADQTVKGGRQLFVKPPSGKSAV